MYFGRGIRGSSEADVLSAEARVEKEVETRGRRSGQVGNGTITAGSGKHKLE
jgi:hypothetical protein